MRREDAFYRALRVRDPRFDGKFFVGVKTTGIYCRPICPAKPKRENVEFFPNALAAERAGYRPCLRCRPESAPRSPARMGKSAIVQRAMKMIHDRNVIDFDEEEFATLFGVSARHLRRLFIDEIGKTPKQLAFESRLNLARGLIVETGLPLSEIAFVSGFASVRRFNDAFRSRFKKSPSQIRRQKSRDPSAVKLTLTYRPPFDFETLLRFYRNHQVGRLERFSPGRMWRLLSFAGRKGTLEVANDPEHSCLRLAIDFPDPSVLPEILARTRAMFDLDSDPLVIANALEVDPKTRALLRRGPGIRVPSGWDGFEVACGTILGQLVSVDRGRALVDDLIQMLGEESGVLDEQGVPIRLFPRPERIAASSLEGLKTTTSRRRTLREFAATVAAGEISLEPTQDVDQFVEKILKLHGIGPWSANYMAMKVLRHADAFPESDLILARALELHPREVLERMRPWRAYAAALFWREYSIPLKKTARRKS